MRKFVVAAVAAVAVGLGTAGTADAQLVYGYTGPAGNGFVNNRALVTPGTFQTYNSFASPFYGTFQKQATYSDIFGNAAGRAYGFNPYTGQSYSYGFYRPNPFFNPYGGYNYGFYGRRFPW
ncbi:MAG: hypothetical protein C0501_17995 [Isosphaera sp.]|nr:hypothetical protein [Isosphaera sp.]